MSGAPPHNSNKQQSHDMRRRQQQQQYCRFHFQYGSCRYGDDCRFSHDDGGGALSREEVLRTIPCPFHFSPGGDGSHTPITL